MSEKTKLSRKNFLQVVVVGIGGVLTALYGIPAIAYVVMPALKKDKSNDWLRLGPTSKVEPGTPTLFSVKIERQTGWIVNEEEIMVYIYTEDGRNYESISNVCTHLGCRVRWIDEQQQFFCPCHNGVYDKQGNVLAGPPPRPLARYELNIKDEDIYIKVG